MLQTDRQNRTIRIFISSTFRDMQEERDELVKYTFPKLRALCESRGVVWGEVDLRWGITDEEKAEGKVLPLCLEEIKNCRPYFIGLLGERYGWVPDEIPKEIIEAEPWLQEHLNHSVTELEILHGVLRNPDMAGHAFFYFRDPSYVDKLPEDTRKDFVEEVAEDEVKRFGDDDALLRANDRRNKLALLKDRVRKSGFSVRENYPDPRALGEVVLKDITSVIDKLFPEGSNPDPLDREASDHEQFARSRASVYIGRQEYFERLNQHAKSDAQPLAVLGESGSGKSALLSTWALRHMEKNPDDLLIMHFIGATPYSADWMAMIRRIMGEFKRHFNIEGDIPDKPDELKMAFANWLHMASAKGKAVLILDALNQFEDKDNAPDLVWMPPFIPPNIRIIVSTLPGRPLEEITRRGWQTLKVEPLNKEEKKELLAEYLKQYSKKLTKEQSDIIADAPQTANPLFLRALLEELRLYGDHFKIDERIKHYLNTSTIDDLYEKILERYEQDYERDRPGLAGDAFSLIWASRKGLSEKEILELLGTDGLPLPAAHWSPLHLAAKDSLVSRSGLISFSHDYLRMAVEDRYLITEDLKKHYHKVIADYFEKQDLKSRKIDELPWQLFRIGDFGKLASCITQIPMFMHLTSEDKKYELLNYWHTLDDTINVIQAYNDSIERYLKEKRGIRPDIFEKLVDIAYLVGNVEAEKIWLLKWTSFCSSKKNNKSKLFLSKSYFLHRNGKQNDAIKFAVRAGKCAEDEQIRFQCEIDTIMYLTFAGRSNQAITRVEKVEQTFPNFLSYNKKARAFYYLQTSFPFHDLDLNEKFYSYNSIAKDIFKDIGFIYNFCIAGVNTGDGYWGAGKIDNAHFELENSYSKAIELNIHHAQNISAICIANLLSSLGSYDEAIKLYKEGIELSIKIGHKWDELYGRIYLLLAEAELERKNKMEELIKISEYSKDCSYGYLSKLALAYGVVSALAEKTLNLSNLSMINDICMQLKKTNYPIAVAYASAVMLIIDKKNNDKRKHMTKLCKVMSLMEGVKGRPGILLAALKTNLSLDENREILNQWEKRYESCKKMFDADIERYSLIKEIN